MSESCKAVAKRCALLIEAYWKERDFTVSVTYDALKNADTGKVEASALYPLRSDMINGLPRRGPVRRPAVAA